MLWVVSLLQLVASSIDGVESDFAISIIMVNFMSGCAAENRRLSQYANLHGINADRALAASLSADYVRRLTIILADHAINSDKSVDTAFPTALSESLRATQECWTLSSLLWRDILYAEASRKLDSALQKYWISVLFRDEIASLRFAATRVAADAATWSAQEHDIVVNYKALEVAGLRLLETGHTEDAIERHIVARERLLVSTRAALSSMIKTVHFKYLERFTLGNLAKYFTNMELFKPVVITLFSLILAAVARGYIKPWKNFNP